MTELTYLLFLKMAQETNSREQARLASFQPHGRPGPTEMGRRFQNSALPGFRPAASGRILVARNGQVCFQPELLRLENTPEGSVRVALEYR